MGTIVTHTQLFGYAEADGTWGKISNREEIKRALALVLDMIHAVHVPLLGMDIGAKGDFGLEQLFVEARLATVDRLATTLREAFGLFTAQCEEYRESLSAAAPASPLGGLAGSLEALKERAIDDAGAAEFVAALPRGADTVLGEGGRRLSGGQRQRRKSAQRRAKDAREHHGRPRRPRARRGPRSQVQAPPGRLPAPGRGAERRRLRR